jgi:hypothetical protein
MRHQRSRASLGALLSAFVVLAGGAAKADIIPTFVGFALDGSNPGECTFSYNAFLTEKSKMWGTADPDNNGIESFWTLYDVHGFTGNVIMPADWTFSTALTGVDGVDPTTFAGDDPSVINVTFTYVGAGTVIAGTGLDLGIFGVNSIYCNVGKNLVTFTGQSVKDVAPINTKLGNGGFIEGPAGPEASSLMLLLPGLVPLGIMVRRRRKA